MTPRQRDPTSARLPRLPALFRPRDLVSSGVSRSRLRGMLRTGEVERVGRGLYRLRSAPVTELETIALVSKRVPHAIVCLLTALHIHGIGTQAPREVWIALHRKARKPKAAGLPIRVVRFSGPMLTYAVEARDVQGVEVRVTSPARTVVDCFRYRNKLGLDIAIEALRDALRSRRASLDQIVRAAEVCRVRSVILPYLEVLGA